MDMFSLSSALLSPPCFLLSGFGSGNSAYTVNYKDVCAGVNHPSVIGKLFSVQILATGSPAGYVQMSKSEGQTDFGVQGMNAIAVPGCSNHLSPSISFHFAEIAELVPKRRRGISRLPATRKTRQPNKPHKLYELYEPNKLDQSPSVSMSLHLSPQTQQTQQTLRTPSRFCDCVAISGPGGAR